ncbi:hypothetical protein OQA88_4747 [Cercophora sp. LCS_1]
MYQPQPTPLFQAGYGMGHGLPQYTFDETPLGLGGGGGGGYGAGPGAAGAGSGGGAGTLIYTTPIFSGSSPAVGPASGPFHQFHHSSPSSTSSPASSVLGHHQHHRSSPHSQHSSSSVKMEPSHDVHAQEAAAREYQPNLQGPLVGNRTPSTAVTEEYAKADPVYVQKTLLLPQTYSHYRPIQGDGNCGWRAIGFGYFETLVRVGTKTQIDAEKHRLESLNSYIETVGGLSPFLFQDMAEETIELMGRLSNLIGNREQAMTELLASFNNPEIANSILYHLRLLASSYLKGNPDNYAAFITTDSGVPGYCTDVIERHNVEIEHLGIALLVNILLKPAGFVLEVAYLDRSPGTQVNAYRFPEEANGRHMSELGPMIHLLYRPDHYDILYPSDQNLPPAPAGPVNIQVNRAAAFSQPYISDTPLYSAAGLATNPLVALIPDFDPPSSGLDGPFGLGTSSPISPYAASPASPWTAHYQEPIAPAPVPPQRTMPIRAASVQVQTNPLRFSEYCQLPEYVGNNSWPKEPDLQTATFKNSHFNTAHYNNPNFQPEEYKGPDAGGSDDHDPPPRNTGRKRGSV